jgi:hypothetical protein
MCSNPPLAPSLLLKITATVVSATNKRSQARTRLAGRRVTPDCHEAPRSVRSGWLHSFSAGGVAFTCPVDRTIRLLRRLPALPNMLCAPRRQYSFRNSFWPAHCAAQCTHATMPRGFVPLLRLTVPRPPATVRARSCRAGPGQAPSCLRSPYLHQA